MARFHQINGELVQFSAEEEIQRDAEIAAWVAGENDRAMAEIRQERNEKLAASDWRGISDNTMSEDWKLFRQQLRDFPGVVDLENIVWPKEPEK